jgi:hypothetical protein
MQGIFDACGLFVDKNAFLDGDAENNAVSKARWQVFCSASYLNGPDRFPDHIQLTDK